MCWQINKASIILQATTIANDAKRIDINVDRYFQKLEGKDAWADAELDGVFKLLGCLDCPPDPPPDPRRHV